MALSLEYRCRCSYQVLQGSICPAAVCGFLFRPSKMVLDLATLPDVLKGDDSSPAIFVGGGGPAFTRGNLNQLIVEFAETLRKSGIKPGDVITIAETNTVRLFCCVVVVLTERSWHDPSLRTLWAPLAPPHPIAARL